MGWIIALLFVIGVIVLAIQYWYITLALGAIGLVIYLRDQQMTDELKSLLPDGWKDHAYLLPRKEHTIAVVFYVTMAFISAGVFIKAEAPVWSVLFAFVFWCVAAGWYAWDDEMRLQQFRDTFSNMTVAEREAYLAAALKKHRALSTQYSPPEYEYEEHIHYRPTKPGFERGFHGKYKEVGKTVVRREKKM